MHYDWIIHNGAAVTVNQSFDIIPDAVLCIKDARLSEVMARDPQTALPPATHTLDAGGGLILPGLINSHTHLPMTLFRGMADDLPLMEWLNDFIFPAEARYITPETVYCASLLGCLELLLGGVTTCCDGYFYEDIVARAIQASGMRAIAGQGVIDFPAPGVADPARNIEHVVAFIEQWQHASPLITPSVFCHSAYTCSAATLQAAHAAARRYNLTFQIHVCETRAEQAIIQKEHSCTPVAWLEHLGLLDPHTLLIHGVWLDAADIACIARHGCRLVHTPESNMKLGVGVAPLPACLTAGIPTGLGTDGAASNNNQDMFQEMGTTARLHKVYHLDPTVLGARTVLEMATRQGAAAIGLASAIGSLEPGKQADVIIIDTAQPHLTPLYHPESQIVYAAGSQDVRDVMVAGQLLVRNRQCVTLDADRIIRDVAQHAQKIRSNSHP